MGSSRFLDITVSAAPLTSHRLSDGLRSQGDLPFLRKVWQFCTVLLALNHDGGASSDTEVCPRICLPKHSMTLPVTLVALDDAASLDSLNAVTSAQPDLKSHLLREWDGVGSGPDANALSQVPITLHGWTVFHWGSFHRSWAGYGVDGHLWCCTALPSPHLQTHQTSQLPVFKCHPDGAAWAPHLAAELLCICCPISASQQHVSTACIQLGPDKMMRA